MNSFFTELGRTALARWKETNFSLPQFPAIATALLDERKPSEHIDADALIRDFLLNDEQPLQTGSGFGQPELVVFDDPRLYIQVLFWLDGTTDIHQHKFSGAFHVMAGSSIHTSFDFANPEPVSAHLRLGTLRMKECELLATGSTVPIISGSAHIHSLFHLETPSITVVLRTHSDPGTGPQFTYLPPHIAVNPFHDDALTTRRKQLLDVLETTGDGSYPDVVAEMLRELDFERGFFMLQNGITYLRALGAWTECLAIFRKKHGRLAEFVEPALDEILRRDAMVEMRRAVTDIEHRFFLALLLNVPTRAALLALIEQRFEGDPLTAAMRWIEELSELSELGANVVDALMPPEIEAQYDAETILAGVRYLIEKAGDPDAIPPLAMAADDVVALADALRRSSLRTLITP